MSKYIDTFKQMIQQNKTQFDQFKTVHDLYMENPKKYQNELNSIGSEIQDIIRIYENRLCGHSESSGYGKFSSKLAEKFHEYIKKHFPKIDFVGMEDS